jgi:hypothetical protein
MMNVRRFGAWTTALLVLPLLAGCGEPAGNQDQQIAELERQLAETQSQLAAATGQDAAAGGAEAAAPPAQGSAGAPAPAQAGGGTAAGPAAPEAGPSSVTLPEGTAIAARTAAVLSTESLTNGATFDAVLEEDLRIDGILIAARGARVGGTVVSSDPGGRVKGVASLQVTARSIARPDGTSLDLRTSSYTVQAESRKTEDTRNTAILTGAGALIGAIAGGGKGAAIGAGAGAATGVGAAVATRGDAAVIPAETLITFRLTGPVTVDLR